MTLPAEPTAPPAPVFRYGYLPSAHCIRYFLGTNAPPTGVTGWDVKLIRGRDNQQIAHQTGRFPIGDANGFRMHIPALQDGEHKLQLWFTGPNLHQQALERTFPHVTYPWAKLKLGMEDVLVPPFTPIRVETVRSTDFSRNPSAEMPSPESFRGTTNRRTIVHTVLREHTMSGAGLWTQVRSQGIELLTGAMRLEVVSGGQTYIANGKGVTFSKRSPTRVTGNATWNAGPIRTATTEFDYDYDGLMKVALHLPKTKQTVDSLKLVIPLKEGEAKYMHEVTDMLRAHPSQSIPPGSGKVWDSSQAWRSNLPAPFVPYVWIGGAERGIAWCAENDKDWIVQPTDGVIELERSGGAVNLVVRFITTPSKLTRPRTIQFGLQATPAKPMPEKPANWRLWTWGFSSHPDAVQFEYLGGGLAWGQPVNCIQFYPAFKNFSIYDEFVKRRELGVTEGTAFRDQWLGQYPPDFPSAPGFWGTNLYATSIDGGLWFARSRMKNSIITNNVCDGLEGVRTLPLTLGDGDPDCSYSRVTNHPSPFVSETFTANTISGLLVDNSVRRNPSLKTSGFGISSNHWVNIQFDVRPGSGNDELWQYVVGESLASPLHCDVRINGRQFGVLGRRKAGESRRFIPIPNITVLAGDWYHFYLTCAPSRSAAADRTYSLTVTRQDSAGHRTYGTVRGVLQEASQPIDLFAVCHVATKKTSGTGQLQIDNLLVNTVKPFWVLPYTNARGINWADAPNHMSEAGTYFDEWSIIDVADPRWDDAVAPGRKGEYHFLRENNASYFTRDNGYGMVVACWYDVDPVESMADMMLYYHRKMLENGMADGIYWDDFFLKANYCPVPGPGYVGDDGKLHAGVNLYAFRNLLKRFATMQHVMGMRPLPFPHVTNTHIVPMLSFSTLLLNLEDIGSGTINDDLQDRFNMDADCARVLTEMTGFQSGNISAIHDQFTGTNRPHLLRTALAVALTHEFKLATYDTAIFFPTQDRLAHFGYGQPDCKVYRYWEGPQPVKTSGAPVKLLVLQRPHGTANKAYVIVGSFGEGGDMELALDATALGLPAGYRAYDDETGAELPPLAPDRYRVNIVKHEFKLIRIQ